MSFFEIGLIAVSLAMDAFAVSLGVSTCYPARRGRLRLAFHFGVFQALMPVLGWFLGASIASYISAFDHWIAFGLLAFVGGRMIRSGLRTDCESYRSDPTRGLLLVLLSVATSIDALAVGLSLAMLRIDIWYPSVIIGIITAGISVLGGMLGQRLGDTFGKRMEIVGGVVLILIGLRIVVTHML